MTGFLEIRTLYEAYLEKAMDVELKHNPADGIFGFGRKTSDDPCHEKFAEDLKAVEQQPEGAFNGLDYANLSAMVVFSPSSTEHVFEDKNKGYLA